MKITQKSIQPIFDNIEIIGFDLSKIDVESSDLLLLLDIITVYSPISVTKLTYDFIEWHNKLYKTTIPENLVMRGIYSLLKNEALILGREKW